MLNRLRSGPFANVCEDRLALGAISAVHAYLDQLVAFQTAVDFRENRGRQPGAADPHDRIERMRSRL